MKSTLMLAFGVMVATASTAALAEVETKKIHRSDRIVVVKNQIPQIDINPFSEAKRVARTDRVSYTFPKMDSEPAAKVKRIVRNDRVVITQEKLES
jgi:hypothetical protein